MNVRRPKSLTEAVRLQTETKGCYIAGGTFSMVEIAADRFHPDTLIDLSLCGELYGIREEGAWVSVGALTTFTEIEKSAVLKKYFPALVKSASEVGGPQVRNRGTVGGNICAASPAADSAPALLALNAEAVVTGTQGTRVIPMDELFLAPKKTCLSADEVLISVRLPKMGHTSSFMKVGKRNALAVSSVCMAVSALVTDGSIDELRIAAGACAPTPRSCPKTAEALLGAVTPEKIAAAQEILMGEISPIDDRWATAEYRRLVAKNMLESLVESVIKEESK